MNVKIFGTFAVDIKGYRYILLMYQFMLNYLCCI